MKYNKGMRSIEEIDAKISQYEIVIKREENKRMIFHILSYVVFLIMGLLFFSPMLLLPNGNDRIDFVIYYLAVAFGCLAVFIIIVPGQIELIFDKRILRRSAIIDSLMEAKIIIIDISGEKLICDRLDALIASRPKKPWIFALIEAKEYWIKCQARIAAYSWVASDAPEPED